MIRHLTLVPAAVALLALGPVLPAHGQEDAAPHHERLVVSIPVGWAPAGANSSETNYGTLYASPGNASEAIAVQQLLGSADTPPSDILTRFAEASSQGCAESAITDPTQGQIGGRLSVNVVLTCLHDDGEAEITRLTMVRGDSDLHIITQIWTGSAEAIEDPERMARWDRFIGALDYCADPDCR